ncbi:hypothetical protein FOA52_000672 [Chlamydomonas sp. UWO 241]|nr:hypothetical protein FOA52_000672 [Chlamydomonas sp. UWO 241]
MYNPVTYGQQNAAGIQACQVQALRPTFWGSNWVLFTTIPFILATALQYLNVRVATVAGLAASGALALTGLLVRGLDLRQVWWYGLEVAMMVVYASTLGAAYSSSSNEVIIANNFNFIVNGGLALICMATILLDFPATLPHIREAVPWVARRHGSVKSCAFYTTVAFVFVFIINTLLYIIPVAMGRLGDASKDDSLNYVFRMILPILFFFFAALATRLAPLTLKKQMQDSVGFDKTAGAADAFTPVMAMHPDAKATYGNPLAYNP